jgi:hypothetical protein
VFFACMFATFSWGTAFVETLASFYVGYGASMGARSAQYGLLPTDLSPV